MTYLTGTDLHLAARIEQVKSSCGLGNFFENTVPTLAHNGNVTPTSDNELGMFYCQCPSVSIQVIIVEKEHGYLKLFAKMFLM